MNYPLRAGSLSVVSHCIIRCEPVQKKCELVRNAVRYSQRFGLKRVTEELDGVSGGRRKLLSFCRSLSSLSL